MWWLFILITVLLVATYLLLPEPTEPTPDRAGLDEFSFPDNSNWRAIPVLYGTVWLHGNVLEYCCLSSKPIKACQ